MANSDWPPRWATKPGDVIEAFGARGTIKVIVRCGHFEDQDVIVITRDDGAHEAVDRRHTRKT